MISPRWEGEFHAYIGGICRNLGATPLAVGGVEDHIHLAVGIDTKTAVADLMREIKKASSVWAKERDGRFAWQTGYAAFSFGPEAQDAVRAYISQQREHHERIDSAGELRRLLEEHSVALDERFFQ